MWEVYPGGKFQTRFGVGDTKICPAYAERVDASLTKRVTWRIERGTIVGDAGELE